MGQEAEQIVYSEVASIQSHIQGVERGLPFGGFLKRWNHKGYPAVYADGSASLPILVVFVNAALNRLATNQCLIIGFTH
ncbi:MAG: hypothetical protein V5B78_12800 [Desulfohalobiaceae bacterium]